jgi:RimJ/RimL family protein N-acetyltransferase
MAESRVLNTPRLQIVPFNETFLTDRYVGWLNDPEVTRYSEQRHHRHTLDTCRSYWQSFQGAPSYFWAIVARDKKLGHIGNINAYVDLPNLVADMGILIGERAAWGNGFGSEAWIAVCDYLLHEAGMRKVAAGTMANNVGMLKKAGMVEDGVRKRHFLFEGQEVDLIHTALYRER